MREGQVCLGWRVAWWTAASLVVAAGAWAGVEGTHHDMRIYNLAEEKSVCAYCHVPHRAANAEKLFAREGAGVEGLGPIGNFCYSCHDGTVIPTALTEAPDGSVGTEALLGSHGYEIAQIEEVSEGLESAQAVYASGLVPVDDPANPPQRLDCTACHDPHTDQYSPFLKAPLKELCQRCHSGQGRTGRGRWTTVDATGGANWAHPVGMPVADSGRDHVRGRDEELSFHGPDPRFDVPAREPEELRTPLVHWETGGHLLGPDRSVGCPTCHSAHLPAPNLLVAEVPGAPEEVLCAGCHTDGQNLENPGATPYYHPVFGSALPPYEHDHASHGDVGDPNIPATGTMDLFVSLPPEWPLGDRGELLCRTCHRAHRGVPGEKCLRWGPAREIVICNECHGPGDQTGDKNWHHPVGSSDYTADENGAFPKDVAWSRGPETPGDLSDGLQCVDCHVELAKSAHNW